MFFTTTYQINRNPGDHLKQIVRDIARLTPNQWLTLISLLVVLNLVIVGGLLWSIASEVMPEQVTFSQVVLAQAEPTRTPFPTFTPPPPVYYDSQSGEVVGDPTATNTLVPTWTPSITPTPLPTSTPTATPIPTNTPVPPVALRVIANTPTPAPTPTPNVDFIMSVRQLAPCENQGKHHIFIHVRDQAGNPMSGMRVKVFWPGGESIVVTGTKIEDAGLTDFAMFKGSYTIQMADFSSQVAGPVTPDIAQDMVCSKNGNTVANSLFHYSYEVIFTKAR